MEWNDRDSQAVVKVKQRLSREGKRKARADVEWWEMMMIETCRPRKFRKLFGGRVRAFEAVDWGAEEVEKELMRICREKLVVLKGVLVRLSGEEREERPFTANHTCSGEPYNVCVCFLIGHLHKLFFSFCLSDIY
jgi:hypothetical protein